MIVSFFKKSGSPQSAVNYLLRDGAEKIAGNEALFLSIANNLPFKQQYTSGVIAFAKERTKAEIWQVMQIYDKFLRPFPESPQALWVMHNDKGRQELHFIIPNVNLETGKHYSPWVMKRDIKAKVELDHYIIKQILKDEDEIPIKKKAFKAVSNFDNAKSFITKQESHTSLADSITDHLISFIKNNLPKPTTASQIINELESFLKAKDEAYSIVKRGAKSYSVQHPDLKKPIRIKSEFFNADFNAENLEKFIKQPNASRKQAIATASKEEAATSFNTRQKSIVSNATPLKNEKIIEENSAVIKEKGLKTDKTSKKTETVYYKKRKIGVLETTATSVTAKNFKSVKAMAFNAVKKAKELGLNNIVVTTGSEEVKIAVFTYLIKANISIANDSKEDLALIINIREQLEQEKLEKMLKTGEKGGEKAVFDEIEAKKQEKMAEFEDKQPEIKPVMHKNSEKMAENEEKRLSFGELMTESAEKMDKNRLNEAKNDIEQQKELIFKKKRLGKQVKE
ncbi:MAG: relaxase/mobilization nuclease domain-containing protein [Alphaproteobacteria bacterium]